MKKIVLFFCVALICLYYYGMQLMLCIVPEGDVKGISVPTYQGDLWNISFTHSVEKTTWDEYFKVNAAHAMTMTHTCFVSLGWGYPYSPSDGKFSRTEDGRFMMEMNRPYKDVDLRISEQAMQKIVHGKDVYDLVQLYGQGTAIKIKAQYRYENWLDCVRNW